MAEKYKDDLTIIGISLDTAESSWRKEIEEIGPTWLTLNAPQGNDIRGLYEIIDGIPHRVIISPDGIILDSWSGYEKGFAETKLLEHLGK